MALKNNCPLIYYYITHLQCHSLLFAYVGILTLSSEINLLKGLFFLTKLYAVLSIDYLVLIRLVIH